MGLMIIEPEVANAKPIVADVWTSIGDLTVMDIGQFYSIHFRIIDGPAKVSDRIRMAVKPVFDITVPAGIGTAGESVTEPGNVDASWGFGDNYRLLSQMPFTVSVARMPAFRIYAMMETGSDASVTTLGVTVAHGA